MRPELQEIVDDAARLLGAATLLEDRHLNLATYAVQPSEIDTVRRDSILRRRSTPEVRAWFESFGITEAEEPLRIPADPEADVQARICFPARWGGVTYGYLWALDEHTPLDDPAVATVARLAGDAAVYLAQIGRQRTDIALAVADLVGADADKAAAAASRLAERGLLERHAPLTVVVANASDTLVPRVAPGPWDLPRNTLIDVNPSGALLIVPLRSETDIRLATEVASTVLRLYRSELPQEWPGRLSAGIGHPRTSATDLHRCWLEARTAARVAGQPDHDAVASWDDLGVYRLLAAAPSAELSAILVEGPVRRLLATGDPVLIHSVEAFLDNAGNVGATATELHVHRQTLYYRLQKAETITGLRFADGNNRLLLHLGLMLAPYLDA